MWKQTIFRNAHAIIRSRAPSPNTMSRPFTQVLNGTWVLWFPVCEHDAIFCRCPGNSARALIVKMALTQRVQKPILSWINFACVTGAGISIQGGNWSCISHVFIKWTHDCISAPFTDTQTQLNQQIFATVCHLSGRHPRKQKSTGSRPWVVIGRFRSFLFVSMILKFFWNSKFAKCF